MCEDVDCVAACGRPRAEALAGDAHAAVAKATTSVAAMGKRRSDGVIAVTSSLSGSAAAAMVDPSPSSHPGGHSLDTALSAGLLPPFFAAPWSQLPFVVLDGTHCGPRAPAEGDRRTDMR